MAHFSGCPNQPQCGTPLCHTSDLDAFALGDLVLRVDSEAGFNYVLEASPDVQPASWTGIQTNVGGGLITFTIPVAPVPPSQFYRIRVE